MSSKNENVSKIIKYYHHYGALSGAFTGTIMGAISSVVKVLQAAKAWDRGKFTTGYKAMKYHYNKNVVSEGFKKGTM